MSVKNPRKIGVDASTRDELRALKKGGDTFDDVVRRLLKEWNDPRGIDFMIQPSTRDALVEISQKGESYDVVIRRLIKYWVLEEKPIESGGRILELLGEEEVKE